MVDIAAHEDPAHDGADTAASIPAEGGRQGAPGQQAAQPPDGSLSQELARVLAGAVRTRARFGYSLARTQKIDTGNLLRLLGAARQKLTVENLDGLLRRATEGT